MGVEWMKRHTDGVNDLVNHFLAEFKFLVLGVAVADILCDHSNVSVVVLEAFSSASMGFVAVLIVVQSRANERAITDTAVALG